MNVITALLPSPSSQNAVRWLGFVADRIVLKPLQGFVAILVGIVLASAEVAQAAVRAMMNESVYRQLSEAGMACLKNGADLLVAAITITICFAVIVAGTWTCLHLVSCGWPVWLAVLVVCLI